MTVNGTYIGDIESLVRLNDELQRTGREMADINENVRNYLNRVQDTLDRQLDFLHEKLEEAEARLCEAESALSSCHASQIFVPELGGYVPTCISEEVEVASAREEVAEWRHKYAEGQQIMGECQSEISDYNSPSGGNGLIEKMANDQTSYAMDRLSECISKSRDILATDVQVKQIHQNVQSDILPTEQNHKDQRLDVFRNNIRGLL